MRVCMGIDFNFIFIIIITIVLVECESSCSLPSTAGYPRSILKIRLSSCYVRLILQKLNFNFKLNQHYLFSIDVKVLLSRLLERSCRLKLKNLIVLSSSLTILLDHRTLLIYVLRNECR